MQLVCSRGISFWTESQSHLASIARGVSSSMANPGLLVSSTAHLHHLPSQVQEVSFANLILKFLSKERNFISLSKQQKIPPCSSSSGSTYSLLKVCMYLLVACTH